MFTSNMSDRGDSNARPLRPERSALPTALLSDCDCKISKKFWILEVLNTDFVGERDKKRRFSKKIGVQIFGIPKKGCNFAPETRGHLVSQTKVWGMV